MVATPAPASRPSSRRRPMPLSGTPVSYFSIHWLQVQVLNDPQQLKAQAIRFGLSAFVVGCPAPAASAPVLWGVQCRGRLCGRVTALGGSSPRSPRSAVSEGRARAHGGSQGRRRTLRELNLAHRRTRAPRLLDKGGAGVQGTGRCDSTEAKHREPSAPRALETSPNSSSRQMSA